MTSHGTRQLIANLDEIAVTVATAAAERVGHIGRSGLSVNTKSSVTDMVTNVDLAADAFIREQLANRAPNDSVVTEEHDSIEGTSDVTWVVDPIDGTTNFVYGLAPYTVSIAAMIDQRPIVGVVVDISSGSIARACSGGTATLNGSPIAIRPPVELQRTLAMTGFGYDRGRRHQQATALTQILPQIQDIRRLGAASWDICTVAAGQADAYFERELKLWDFAAAWCIATQAGAAVEAIEGGPPVPGSVLVAHPQRIGQLRELILSAGG